MSQEILEQFDFEGKRVRTVMIDNAPWFVATDVAKILGYRDAERMTRNLRERNKGTHSVGTPGGVQAVKIINEPGLYQAVMKSKLPSAEGFQDWVTDEVLPSIRKHGVYMTDEVRAEAMISPDFLRDIAHTLEEEIQKREALEAELVEVAPKVAFAEAVEASEDSITLTETAQLLTAVTGGMGRVNFIRCLRENGYLYRHNTSGIALPVKKYLSNGIFEVVQTGYWDNNIQEWVPTVQTRVTGKGQIHFLNKFQGEEMVVAAC